MTGNKAKTYLPEGEELPASQIGATLEALEATIASRGALVRGLVAQGAATEGVKSQEAFPEGAATEGVKSQEVFPREAAQSQEAFPEDGEQSYTCRLLSGDESFLCAKIEEEAGEVVAATHEGDTDHLRYEVADVIYHLMVLLQRHRIPLDELAAELNMRMRPEECPQGGIRLFSRHVNRGK
ncbi:MAG: phosphoribosyl-ATP diphosphatase [Coriobacteriaceae bacterium]|jgi:phosphoribosyl-ATP pyrophosphohydrolase/phosphoribosyl-ATP pyrophosphohydrolase/phosphoribosyl-AMP cyclohydrolase|nr:phosphoribosyl-ATP diphosphatase [Coriobacteriaceae bacterium]